ncbi:hotdog domain-containing protein [Streptomyces sp. NPDC096153]|uniref:PaaI family thioesterase n=1 Tax=Streptomyces sp. NPDC096153 TaxID=3155548 RepID=UPI00331C67C7
MGIRLSRRSPLGPPFGTGRAPASRRGPGGVPGRARTAGRDGHTPRGRSRGVRDRARRPSLQTRWAACTGPSGVGHGRGARLGGDEQLPAGSTCTTTQLGLHLLRPVYADTSPLRVTGTALHLGRTTATAEARVTGIEDGKLHAHGTRTCAVVSFPAGRAGAGRTCGPGAVCAPGPHGHGGGVRP